MSDFDYVTVGHVTVDVLAAAGGEGPEERRPGGGAFYSALQAARLGLRTLILTRGRPEELQELLAPYREELQLRVTPAPHTTTLATSGTGVGRRQRVLAWAGAIEEPQIPDTEILHLAAVARETPRRWHGQARFVGATPQGLMREWNEQGEISLTHLPPDALPAHLDAAVVSANELPWCEGLTRRTLTAVTAGAGPTRVHVPHDPQGPDRPQGPGGGTLTVPSPDLAEPSDDLGAGDVFAAAFFVALHEGQAPREAAVFGNAAAAVRLGNFGAGAVGTRTQVQRRMEEDAG